MVMNQRWIVQGSIEEEEPIVAFRALAHNEIIVVLCYMHTISMCQLLVNYFYTIHTSTLDMMFLSNLHHPYLHPCHHTRPTPRSISDYPHIIHIQHTNSIMPHQPPPQSLPLLPLLTNDQASEA
jgi:hypothetical protein